MTSSRSRSGNSSELGQRDQPSRPPEPVKQDSFSGLLYHPKRPNPSWSGTLEQTSSPRTRTLEEPNPPRTRTPFRLASW
ncbi:unnamed protein product [Prunus brigantina]